MEKSNDWIMNRIAKTKSVYNVTFWEKQYQERRNISNRLSKMSGKYQRSNYFVKGVHEIHNPVQSVQLTEKRLRPKFDRFNYQAELVGKQFPKDSHR